jgi:hypothetical protein
MLVGNLTMHFALKMGDVFQWMGQRLWDIIVQVIERVWVKTMMPMLLRMRLLRMKTLEHPWMTMTEFHSKGLEKRAPDLIRV